MASESSIIQPILAAVVVDVLSGAVIKPAAAGGTFTYIQSDGPNYFQPDGSSLYLIP
jgi:hypothetical protein